MRIHSDEKTVSDRLGLSIDRSDCIRLLRRRHHGAGDADSRTKREPCITKISAGGSEKP